MLHQRASARKPTVLRRLPPDSVSAGSRIVAHYANRASLVGREPSLRAPRGRFAFARAGQSRSRAIPAVGAASGHAAAGCRPRSAGSVDTAHRIRHSRHRCRSTAGRPHRRASARNRTQGRDRSASAMDSRAARRGRRTRSAGQESSTEACARYRWIASSARGLRQIDADKDTWWIIDYKTAHEDGLDPAAALPELRRIFAPQIEAYAKVLRKLHGADAPVRGGLYYPRM